MKRAATRLVTAVMAVAIGVALTDCSPSRRPTLAPGGPTVPGQGNTGSTTPANGGVGQTGSVARLKPAVAGLLTRDGPPSPALAGVVRGFVVNANWADLQPDASGPIAADNVIDQAIAQARQGGPNGPFALKVRIFGGIHAPNWAKQLGGPPVAVRDPLSGQGGTVGRFWTDAYQRAYAQFQQELAARYDGVPEVREVTAAQCTTVYSEPFIRDVQDASSVHDFLAAGFSVGADEACQRSQIDAHDAWRHTRTSVAFNPYQHINPDGSSSVDEAFTETMMRYCRSRLGPRCVLENNSVRWPQRSTAMYDYMRSLGPPIAFQTAVIRRVGDLAKTLQFCITLRAEAVELPDGAEQAVGAGQLAQANTALAANAQ